MTPKNENEAYVWLLSSHLHHMAHCLRQLNAEQWDWMPDVAAPTARHVSTHAWQWLICDRQHILEPDALKHEPVPDPPSDPAGMADAIIAETERWASLIRSLTPQQMDEPRHQFNLSPLNVRGFLCHAIQNTIYKNGEFATLFYAMGLDGTAPYEAPVPNPIYEEVRQMENAKRLGDG